MIDFPRRRFRRLRVLGCVLAVASLGFGTPRSAHAAPLPGDLDGNGRIDVNDALLVLHGIVGIRALTKAQAQAADLDGAGRITVHDVVLLLRIAVNLDPRVLLTIDTPAPGTAVNTTTTRVVGHVTGPVAVVTINGNSFPVSQGAFGADVPLVSGSNAVTVSARIPQGGVASATVPVIRDSTPPDLTLLSPLPNSLTEDNPVTVTGMASDESGPATVTVNGAPALLSAGTFSTTVSVAPGANTVKVVATDRAGNKTERDLALNYFVSKPEQAQGTDGTKVSFPAGSFEADLPVSVKPLAPADLAPLPATFAVTPKPSADPSHPAITLLGADRILVGDGTAKLLKNPEVEACPQPTLKPGDPILLTEMKPNPLNPGHTMLSLADTMSVSADGRRILSDPIDAASPFPGFARDTDAL